MIGRKNRFHGYGSLKYVYRHGKTVRGPMTALKYTPNKRRKDYRLAVVVSKKVHKSAVARNRIRRRLYEAFRYHQDEIHEPYDMVLTVYNEQIADIPAKDIDKIITNLLKQARIVNFKDQSTKTK